MNTRIALSLTLVGMAILTMGRLFKFLHWPGANIQLLIGSVVLVIALVALSVNVARGRGFRGMVE